MEYGSNRVGDIPHSLASIDKAKELLRYEPKFSLQQRLKEAVDWYWGNLKWFLSFGFLGSEIEDS